MSIIDPATLVKSLESASKVANTPFFITIFDRISGFKFSEWAAEGEIRKKVFSDEYEKAKKNGIIGMQYIVAMRNAKNLIDTAVKSSKHIDPNKPNNMKIDNDFFWNTIEHAKTISNDKVQELVAKIIAGEYNEPDTYSMSTLQALKMLGKNELELFEKTCSLCVNDVLISEDAFLLSEPVMHNVEIDFGDFQELQRLGLFLPNQISFESKKPEKKNYSLEYFDQAIIFEPTHATNFNITLPDCYSLSTTGEQIIKHLNPKFNDYYFKWLKENFKIPNYKVIE